MNYQRLKNIIIVISIIIIITYLIYIDKLSIDCPFYSITNLYCPGCGITRCILSILKLDFYQAFRYNPLVFIMLPFILAYIVYKTHIYVFDKKDIIINKIPNYIYYILLFIVIVFGIIRNIDIFSWLAPTKLY